MAGKIPGRINPGSRPSAALGGVFYFLEGGANRMEAVGDPVLERQEEPVATAADPLCSRVDRLEARIQQLEKAWPQGKTNGYRDADGRAGYPKNPGPWWWAIWLGLADFGMDMGLLPRIFTDPRYRLPWTVRIGVPVLGVAFFLSDYLLPLGLANLPVVGKVFDLLIAGLFFWLIWREVRRYRRVSLDLPETWKTDG